MKFGCGCGVCCFYDGFSLLALVVHLMWCYVTEFGGVLKGDLRPGVFRGGSEMRW